MKIKNKKLTCDLKSQIAEKFNQDLSNCEKFCDQEESCNFFFFNDDGYCSLHFSCADKRVAFTKGSTFETKNGNDINFFIDTKCIEIAFSYDNHSKTNIYF